MRKNTYRRSWKKTLLNSLYIAVLASMVLATALQAAEPQGENRPDAITADDGGKWELGIEGTAGNLPNATAAERTGMRYWLTTYDNWFITRFSFNESTAWEEDFKRAAMGGTENSYLDAVDLMFYVGHGSPARFTFDNATHDDGTLQASADCSASWGDGDNEWLALTSCQVLANSGVGPMAQCMNRQHLILGFVTNAGAFNEYWNTQAYHFGRYMRYGYNMTQSWFKGCDVAQRGRVARVIAEETSCFNDNPFYSNTCADVLDNDYYWYTHSCGTASASALPLDIMQQIDELPIYRVDPYSLEEANEDFEQLSEVFGVPGNATLHTAMLNEDVPPPGPPTGTAFLVSTTTTETLEVDTESGIFNYTNLDQLWTGDAAEQALALRNASVNYISQDDARRIADDFLNTFGLMPSDAQFYQVVQDSTGQQNRASAESGTTVASADDIAQSEVPVNFQVIYSRIISVPMATAAGIQQELEVTVVGPGAKQQVNLPTTGDVSAAGIMQAEPLGVQGGWRAASPVVNAASGEALTAPIYNQATAEALYDALGDDVTLSSLPLDIIDHETLSVTLAYWESAPGNSQGELIPVYEFTKEFTLSDNTTTQGLVYVPASSIYLRPLARITNAPTDVGVPDSPLTLIAEVASQTLQEAGIGGNQFPFVMGYAGADGTYTYEWYHTSVAPENKITDMNPNDGATNITFDLPTIVTDHGRVLDIFLVVTDIDSPNESTSTASAQIMVDATLYMPALEGPAEE